MKALTSDMDPYQHMARLRPQQASFGDLYLLSEDFCPAVTYSPILPSEVLLEKRFYQGVCSLLECPSVWFHGKGWISSEMRLLIAGKQNVLRTSGKFNGKLSTLVIAQRNRTRKNKVWITKVEVFIVLLSRQSL